MIFQADIVKSVWKMNQIDASLFEEYGVKRGLRDKNGKVYCQALPIYP